jgi:hypothetical protein
VTVQTDAEEYADLLARAAPFLKPLRTRAGVEYGRVAVTGDDWLRAAAEPFLRGLPDLPTLETRKFNPNQPRDSDGQWSDGVPGSSLKDTLRLAGKIDLAPDETLVGSAKVDGEAGGIRMALTEQDGRRMLRLGVGGEGYGQRNRDEGTSAWDGNPAREPMPAAERQRLEAEDEALGEEYSDASPARREQIDARQEAIRDQLAEDDQGFNGTAKIDEYSMRRLADRIRPVLAEAVEEEKRQNAAWDEIEALQLDGNPDPERMAVLRRIARADESRGITFDSGIVAGSEWGDVHFSVELDDPSVGVEVRLGVTPKGAPDDWGDGRDWEGRFDAAETRKFLRLLDKYAAAGS